MKFVPNYINRFVNLKILGLVTRHLICINIYTYAIAATLSLVLKFTDSKESSSIIFTYSITSFAFMLSVFVLERSSKWL